MLVKTAGVKHLVILINKMDDPTVKWSEARYNECKDKLTPYLKKVGFNPAKDIQFMPCSGLTGSGLLEPVGDLAKFYTGKAFIPHIDSLSSITRNHDGPFMMPIVDKYADMGAVAMGKVESGKCCVGEILALYPNKVRARARSSSLTCRLLSPYLFFHFFRRKSRLTPYGRTTSQWRRCGAAKTSRSS